MAYGGNSKVTLDSKSRLAIPSRYREALLAECEGKMVMTRGPEDQSLWLFPLPIWEPFAERLLAKPARDKTRRRYLHNSEEVDMDNGGRILIPNGLREKNILTSTELAFVGNGTFFEIWDWNAHLAFENDTDDTPDSDVLDMAF